MESFLSEWDDQGPKTSIDLGLASQGKIASVVGWATAVWLPMSDLALGFRALHRPYNNIGGVKGKKAWHLWGLCMGTRV